MNILVIGCGSIGIRHIKNLINHGKHLIIAFDVSKNRLTNIKQKFPIVLAVSKLEDCWEINPDIAFVTTPTSLHIPLAIEAAEHNCHLFIEKPLSDSVHDLDQLKIIVKKNKLITLVGCNLRFYWAIATIKKILEKKKIGNVLSAQISAGSYLPEWHPKEDYRKLYAAQKKLGGGAILDFIHELDYVRWFFGNIDHIEGMYGKLSALEIDTEDCAEIICKFKQGPLISIHVDYFDRSYRRTCRITGTTGTLFWDFNEHLIKVYTSTTRKWQVIREPVPYDLNRMYDEELQYFFKCIKNQTPADNDIFFAGETLQQALKFKQQATYVK